jgi:hypothetical protein
MINLTKENKNYQSLVDEAEKAFLQKDYLEAFLIQSCVIEGVIKNYSEAKLERELSQSSVLKEKFKNFELARLADDLLLAGKIPAELYENLNNYRKKRNEVTHNLLEYTDKSFLDQELRSAYESGRQMKGLIVDDLAKGIRPSLTRAEIEAHISYLTSQLEELDPGISARMAKEVKPQLS